MLTVLRPYRLMFRNRIRSYSEKTNNFRHDVILIGITLFTMLLIFLCSSFVLNVRILSKIENLSPLLAGLFPKEILLALVPTKLIQMFFYLFLLMLLISNTISSIGNFYSAHDMDLLLSTPVAVHKIFAGKFFQTLAQSGFIFFVFALPIALAYMVNLNVGFIFFVCSFLITIPFLLIPAGLSVVLASIFVRFSSLFWRRGALMLAALFAVIIYSFLHVLALLVTVGEEKGGVVAVVELLGLFDNPNPVWSPARWSADLLSSFVGEPLVMPGLKISLLLAGALASVCLGYLVFDLCHLRIRSAAQSQELKGRGIEDIVRVSIEWFYRLVPLKRDIRAIAVKDLTCIFRDRGQSLQLVLYLGMLLFYITVVKLMVTFVTMFGEANQVWQTVLAFLNVEICGFFLVAIITRLVYPSISLEGRAFWVLLAAPIDRRTLVQAKYLCWMPLTVILSVTLLEAGALAIALPPAALLVTGFVAFALALGCTAVAVGLGAVFATFDWQSHADITAGAGTLVLLCCNFSLVLLSGLPALPLLVFTIIPQASVIIGLWTSFGLFILAALFLVTLHIIAARRAMRVGIKSLEARQLI